MRARKEWSQGISCWSPCAGVLWRGLKRLTVGNKNVTVHMYVHTCLGACLHVEVCGLYTFCTLKSAWGGFFCTKSSHTEYNPNQGRGFYLGLGRKSALKPMAPGDQVQFFSSSSYQGHD